MKEQLTKLKACILVTIMCLNLTSCSETEQDKTKQTDNNINYQKYDSQNYLISFIEGKAIIYESDFSYSTSSGYASIYEDYISIRYIQTPCVVLTGKENCIKFASSIVGEENIIFMDITNEKNQELILKPNN